MTSLAVLVGLSVFFALAERLWPDRQQPLVRRGVLADLAYAALHYVLRVVVNGTLAVLVTAAGRRFLPTWSVGILEGQPLWLQAVGLLLVLDFFFYVMHRLKHRWHWWWRLHETHHSSAELDWLSTARFHPIEKLLDRTIFLLPLLVLGVSDGALVIWAAVDAFFGMFIHANVTWRIGPLIYVFTGPEMHRWHHALDPGRRECNYGNNFSIFDWMFGTASLPRERPARFGIEDPAYPQENLVGQFLYAFRRAPTAGVTGRSGAAPRGARSLS